MAIVKVSRVVRRDAAQTSTCCANFYFFFSNFFFSFSLSSSSSSFLRGVHFTRRRWVLQAYTYNFAAEHNAKYARNVCLRIFCDATHNTIACNAVPAYSDGVIKSSIAIVVVVVKNVCAMLFAYVYICVFVRGFFVCGILVGAPIMDY